MDYVTFLSENYIWIIIVAVIIVMTVIGYIADKTEFGEKKQKKHNKKQNEHVEENIEENKPEENVLVSTINEADEIDNLDKASNEEILSDFEMPVDSNDSYSNFEDNLESNYNEEISEDYIQPQETYQEDNNESIMNENPIDSNMNDEAVEEQLPEETIESVDEEENKSDMFEEENQNETEESILEENQFEEQPQENSEEFELPNIETLNQEIKDVEEDEDVWKF